MTVQDIKLLKRYSTTNIGKIHVMFKYYWHLLQSNKPYYIVYYHQIHSTVYSKTGKNKM